MSAAKEKKTIKVLLLDKHALVRSGLRRIIETHPAMQVVGEAGDYPEVIALVRREKPDIILLDFNLDNSPGLEIISELGELQQAPRVIIVTGDSDNKALNQAVQLGAVGVVRKEESPETLLKAIEKVYEGEVWLRRSMIASVLSNMSRPTPNKSPEAEKIELLSDREREVIALIGEGLKNKEIAEKLYISEVTVRHHLTSVYRKLDISHRLELVVFSYRNGLAVMPD